MKSLFFLLLFVLTTAHGWSQRVFVDPTSVTLTKPGSVTVIVTAKIIGHNVSFDAYLNATVGTIKATYYHAIYANDGTSVGSWMEASAVASGTLEAGTYPLSIETNQDGWDNPNPDPATFPRQITIILWNESAGGGSSTLNDLTLSFASATDADKAAFQTLIVSLVQQQLSALQGQITTQQNQITALQESDSGNASTISFLQEQLGSMQASFDSLLGEFDAVKSRMDQLETQLAGMSTTNGVNGTDGTNGKDSDNTMAYVGAGLGAAGVIGAIMNAVFDSSPEAPSENH